MRLVDLTSRALLLPFLFLLPQPWPLCCAGVRGAAFGLSGAVQHAGSLQASGGIPGTCPSEVMLPKAQLGQGCTWSSASSGHTQHCTQEESSGKEALAPPLAKDLPLDSPVTGEPGSLGSSVVSPGRHLHLAPGSEMLQTSQSSAVRPLLSPTALASCSGTLLVGLRGPCGAPPGSAVCMASAFHCTVTPGLLSAVDAGAL